MSRRIPRLKPTPTRPLLAARPLAAAIVWVLSLLSPAPSMAGFGDCSQPVSSGSTPTASDCAYVLRTAVGTKTCLLCVCDLNNSTTVTTVDALTCLKKAVGLGVSLSCPACQGVTTTTVSDGTPSTTSTSTTSTTTTMPVRCSDNSDCSALPDGFRCNPNSDSCEKPCTKNADCKNDFYTQCNQGTGYCQEPELLF